jgi:hypothetical protein
MSTLQRLIGIALRQLVRRKARGQSLDAAITSLEEFASSLDARIASAADTPGNREAVNHWVGIERWSLRRIRVAQGEPLLRDGYRGYREPDGATLAQLAAAMRTTREATLELARELQRSGFDQALTIPHNDLGPLTVTEWFVYVDQHTRREMVRLRGRAGSP